MSIYRCVECGKFTLYAPLLVLRSWRVHLPCCVDCMTDDRIPLARYVRPVHRSIGAALSALVAGRCCWELEPR